MAEEKNRKHTMIPVSVPVSCSAINAEGCSLNLRMCVAINVSAFGITLELYREIDSNSVLLSFVSVNGGHLELKGNVVSSTKIESGAFRLEVSFQGSHEENIEFAKHLIIAHNRSGQKPETIIDRKTNSPTQ